MIEVKVFKDGELYTDWRPTALTVGSPEYKVLDDLVSDGKEHVKMQGAVWEYHYRKMQ